MLFDISVVYVGVDVHKQLAADLIRLTIEDDDVNHHIIFKQKTAYEMRISDWSSDVCSSDLTVLGVIFAMISHDHKLLILSAGVAITGGVKACSFYRQVSRQQYECLEGDRKSVV